MFYQLDVKKEEFEELHMFYKKYIILECENVLRAGDFLALNEIRELPASHNYYTGKCCIFNIEYVVSDEKYLNPGITLIGISPMEVIPHKPANGVIPIAPAYSQNDYNPRKGIRVVQEVEK